MSEEKRIKARVQNKRKTKAEWYLDVYDAQGVLRKDAFKPLRGELIIFAADYSAENPTGCKYDRSKLGDGVTNVMALPFTDEEIIKKIENLESNTVSLKNGEAPYSIAQDGDDSSSCKVYAKNGTALGYNTIAGSKGYSLAAAAGTDGAEGTYTLNIEPDPSILGKTFSIYLKSNRYQTGVVTKIEGNIITVDNIFLPTGWDQPDSDGDYPITYGYIYFTDDPTLGDVNIGTGAHTEGYGNKAILTGSHSEGANNVSEGKYSHTEGINNYAGYAAHAQGRGNKALGEHSHAGGRNSVASGNQSFTHGESAQALGENSIATGQSTKSTGKNATASGYYSTAHGPNSIAEGSRSIAFHENTYANGASSTRYTEELTANALNEHWNTNKNINAATGSNSKVLGTDSLASGHYSTATGVKTNAAGQYSFTAGHKTKAIGDHSTAIGYQTEAIGQYSTASGRGTKATAYYQTVSGKWNAEDSNALLIVGKGNSDTDRSNAFVSYADGRAAIGKAPEQEMDVVNKDYVDTIFNKYKEHVEIQDKKIANHVSGFTVTKESKNLIVIDDINQNSSTIKLQGTPNSTVYVSNQNFASNKLVPVPKEANRNKATSYTYDVIQATPPKKQYYTFSCEVTNMLDTETIVAVDIKPDGNWVRGFQTSKTLAPFATDNLSLTIYLDDTTYTNFVNIQMYSNYSSNVKLSYCEFNNIVFGLTSMNVDLGSPINSKTKIILDSKGEGNLQVPNYSPILLYTLDNSSIKATYNKDYSIVDDVSELPNIINKNSNRLYRLTTATFIHNRYVVDNSICYIVDSLPDVGEPATNLERNAITAYYDLNDGKVYGYLDETLAAGFTQLAGTTIIAGWYPAEQLLPIAGWAYDGVITDIGKDPNDSTIRLLLEKKVYIYNNEWIELTNSIVDEKLPTPDANGHFAYTVQRRDGVDAYELHLISHTINEAYENGKPMYPYQIPLRENGIIKAAAPKEDLDVVNKGYVDNFSVPRMHVADEENGLNRVYYINSGTPLETTETSVVIPQGKSIIVCALSDTNESDYSYLDKDGNPTAPPKPIAWEDALTTPTVVVEGTRASWEAIDGATKYRYIIGDCVPYMSWGGSFANTYNRLYTELTNDRGTYLRHALTSDVAPRDPDPEDFATGKTLGSIPIRQDNSYILSPAIYANDEAALERLASKGYNLDLYLMPKSYTDSFARKCVEQYFTDNSPVVLGKGENSVVQKDGTDINKVTGKLAAAFGQNNEVSGLRGFAAGTNNNVSGTCAVAFGEGCVNTSWLGITVGRYLKALYNNQHWFGEFNNPVEKDVMGYRVIFGVGCGTSDSNRKNALIVYNDGRASVGREPKLEMDVVNKKYVDDLIKSLTDRITELENKPTNLTYAEEVGF